MINRTGRPGMTRFPKSPLTPTMTVYTMAL